MKEIKLIKKILKIPDITDFFSRNMYTFSLKNKQTSGK